MTAAGDLRRIAIASDHAGFELKNAAADLLRAQGIDAVDLGVYGGEIADYPDYAAAAARAVVSGECECGILICGTGLGMSIAANKFKGIRCAACSDPYTARMAKEHNDANMLALGARVVGAGMASAIIDAYLSARYDPRHQARLDKITYIESKN